MTVLDWILGSAFVLFVLAVVITSSFCDLSEDLGIVFTIREHALFDRYWNRHLKKPKKQKNN